MLVPVVRVTKSTISVAKGGWCIDSLHDKNGVRKCKYDVCDCWCHTGATKPPKAVAKKRAKAKTVVGSLTEDELADVVEQARKKPAIKLNKDGSVPKKRGRPKGSKNKPKEA